MNFLLHGIGESGTGFQPVGKMEDSQDGCPTLQVIERHGSLKLFILSSNAFRLRERYRAVIRFSAKAEVSGVLTPKSVVDAVR